MSNRVANKGLVDYQKMQRKNTLDQIDKAVLFLRENGLPVTKKAIAEEVGMAYNSIKAEYVRIHLLKYPEFNPEIQGGIVSHGTDETKREILSLKEALNKENRSKKIIVAENIKLKAELKELMLKYQRLLGEYQIQVGNKIVPF